MAASLALALGAASAEAKPHHKGDVVLMASKENVWEYTFRVHVPDPEFDVQTVTVTLKTDYYYWNTGGIDHIGIWGYVACYDFYQNPKGLFQGVKLNPLYEDINETADPEGIEVDASGMHGCDEHTIPPSARKWLEVQQSPQIQAHGSVAYGGMQPDQSFEMHTKDYGEGVTYKYIHPGDDTTFSHVLVDTATIKDVTNTRR